MSSLSRHHALARLRPLRVAAAATLCAAAVGAASLPATAAPQSAYPEPARVYVWEPEGFDDAATVDVTTEDGRLTPHCERVPLATSGYGDVQLQVRQELKPLFDELLRQTEVRFGYHLRPGLTGAFSCRMIDGSANVSNHAYGRAIDMNWDRNPMASYFQSDIPPAVVQLWIDNGFYWGGHYTNHKDTMHFEYVAPISSVPFFLNRLATT